MKNEQNNAMKSGKTFLKVFFSAFFSLFLAIVLYIVCFLTMTTEFKDGYEVGAYINFGKDKALLEQCLAEQNFFINMDDLSGLNSCFQKKLNEK